MRYSRVAVVTLFSFLAFASSAVEFEEGWFETEPGVEIYWRAAGEGPAVIVPGGFLFDGDLDHLADGHQLILYDMRNRGQSSSITDPALLTIDGDILDLERIREQFEVPSFSTIGYSYLGKMVVLYAIQHPDRVERLIQIGPVPIRFSSDFPPVLDNTTDPGVDPDELDQLRDLRAEGLHESDPERYCEEEWLVARAQLLGDSDLASRLESRCDLPNEWPTNLAFHLRHHFVSVQKKDLFPIDLVGLDHAVLTIHGRKDRNAPYGSGVEWAAMLPNGRLRTVEGAAHQAWMDEPSVMGEITTFLKGEWPESAEKVVFAKLEWLPQLRGYELLQRLKQRYHLTDDDDADRRLGLRVEGELFSRSQSQSPTPPYDRFPIESEILFDSHGSKMVLDEALVWPSFVSRHRMMYASSSESFLLDLNRGLIVEPSVPIRETWLRQVMLVPSYIVRLALDDPAAIRLLGLVEVDGEPHQIVEVGVGDARIRLLITRHERIGEVSRLVSSDVTGDGLQRFVLTGEQEATGILIPERVQRYLDEELLLDVEITPLDSFDESRFNIPEELEEAAGERPALEISQLEKDLFLMENIGGSDYRSLVVVHEDGLILLETPLNEKAMNEAIAMLQDKFALPVKAAVVTHHHFDHAGGARAAMAAGARIYVPRGTSQLFRTIATAPRTLERKSVAIEPWTARVEEVKEKIFGAENGGAAVHIFSGLENEHADGILFAWIPKYRILFQGDLFVKYGEEPQPARSQGVVFLHRIRELGLDVERLIGVHGEIATINDLERSVALTEAGE